MIINGIYTNQKMSWRMRHTKFSWTLRYKILARRPDLVIVNKKKRTCQIMNFTVLVDHRVKIKENGKKRQVLWPCLRTKKAIEYESDNIIAIGALAVNQTPKKDY